MIVLEIPMVLMSANDHVVNGRDPVARARYKHRRNQWAHAIRMVALGRVAMLDVAPYVDRAGELAMPRPVRAVRIVRLMAARMRPWDDDNMVAACKAVRDACQVPRSWRGKWIAGAAIVRDDSAAWSSWTYAQERAPDGVARTRIEVADIEPAEPARSNER